MVLHPQRAHSALSLQNLRRGFSANLQQQTRGYLENQRFRPLQQRDCLESLLRLEEQEHLAWANQCLEHKVLANQD